MVFVSLHHFHVLSRLSSLSIICHGFSSGFTLLTFLMIYHQFSSFPSLFIIFVPIHDHVSFSSSVSLCFLSYHSPRFSCVFLDFSSFFMLLNHSLFIIYVRVFKLSPFPHYSSFPSVVIIFYHEFNMSYIIFMFLFCFPPFCLQLSFLHNFQQLFIFFVVCHHVALLFILPHNLVILAELCFVPPNPALYRVTESSTFCLIGP